MDSAAASPVDSSQLAFNSEFYRLLESLIRRARADAAANLIGEIVVIPLSGWLSQVFSLRRYLLARHAQGGMAAGASLFPDAALIEIDRFG